MKKSVFIYNFQLNQLLQQSHSKFTDNISTVVVFLLLWNIAVVLFNVPLKNSIQKLQILHVNEDCDNNKLRIEMLTLRQSLFLL